MTSWVVLLIASVLLVAPGEDIPLGVDPDGSSSQPCFLRFDGPKHELQGHLAWVRAAQGRAGQEALGTPHKATSQSWAPAASWALPSQKH